MYDPTFTTSNIRRLIRYEDILKDPFLKIPEYCQEVAEYATAVGQSDTPSYPFSSSILRGKTIWHCNSIAHTLVLRHITGNIKRVTGAIQDNRNFIIDCIRQSLLDGGPYSIFKYDIHRFYESIKFTDVIDELARDVGFPPSLFKLFVPYSLNLQGTARKGYRVGLL